MNIFIGALLSQQILSSYLHPNPNDIERAMLVLQSLSAFAIQLASIGSAAILFTSAFPLFWSRVLAGIGMMK
jgi:hypothetical protein